MVLCHTNNTGYKGVQAARGGPSGVGIRCASRYPVASLRLPSWSLAGPGAIWRNVSGILTQTLF